MTRLSRSEPQNSHCPCLSRGLTTTRRCSFVVQDKKGGETKPFLIPHFVITANYGGSVEDEQEIGGSTDARIILRPPRSKPKLGNISSSMSVPANGPMMPNLTKT